MPILSSEKPRYFKIHFMENNEELLAEGASVEPQKKRTRITKKEVSDHVYSVTGDKGENLDQPKKKRTRKTKAEKEAEAAAAAATAAEEVAEETAVVAEPEQVEETQDVQDAQETVEKTEETVEAEAPVKRKRGRKSKEDIMAAAAAAAAALAMKSQDAQSEEFAEERPSVPEQQTINFEEEAPEGALDGAVPEEMYQKQEGGDEETTNLLEQLQNKVNTSHAEGVWEGDPNDGTDFIIVEDIPVEDNGAIPYYDMFDNPQVANDDVIGDVEEDTEEDSAVDFNDIITANGLLEIMPDGYGFLRSSDYNYLSSPDDVHLNVQQIKQYSLKTGDVVECKVRPPHSGEKYFTMSSITKVNGRNPLDVRDRISFENLTPLFPDEKFDLCGDPGTTNLSTRIVDLFSPIGKGQRSLIVAQPKTGKTMLMKDIANAIAANHPEAYIMMLLIDERPEEVTDMARTVNAEVIASTFDEPADRHVKIAGLVLEKAKRLVECGHDVVIFLDSITRLARAYNTVAPASGKVLTGGVDANALQKPKRFFGAARNIEGGGSLTIIATALTDTGSKMDEVIFEEFKGTGNSELQLDRQLANKRIFPAVNLIQSSTRRDDLLLDSFTSEKMWILRKMISDMNAQEAMSTITGVMKHSSNHKEFLMGMNA
jgi:transcription termination factor Rho